MKVMKLKKNLGILLLATLCLFACSKDNDPTTPTPPPTPELEGSPRSVTLKMLLPDDDTRASVEDEVTAVGAIVNTIDVYFYDEDGGIITAKYSLNTADRTAITSGSGLAFPNIDPITDGVIVVANNDVNKEISADAGQDVYTELFPLLMDIEHEQVFSNITYYGKSTAFVEYTPASPAAGVDYYNAQITIKPLVARLEISDLAVTTLDTISTGDTSFVHGVHLRNVLMDNSYQNVVLDHENLAVNTPDPIVSNLFTSTVALVEANTTAWWMYSYVAASDPDSAYSYPKIPDNDPTSTFSPDVTTPTIDGDGVFAFQFIPSDDPWVRLRIRTEFRARDLYVNVRGFEKDGIPITFQPGFIYKMTLPFDEDDLTEHNDNLLNVTVEVIVQSWTIVNGILPE